MERADEYLLLGVVEALLDEILDLVDLGQDLRELLDFVAANFAGVDGGFLDVHQHGGLARVPAGLEGDLKLVLGAGTVRAAVGLVELETQGRPQAGPEDEDHHVGLGRGRNALDFGLETIRRFQGQLFPEHRDEAEMLDEIALKPFYDPEGQGPFLAHVSGGGHENPFGGFAHAAPPAWRYL